MINYGQASRNKGDGQIEWCAAAVRIDGLMVLVQRTGVGNDKSNITSLREVA
jgi:hypothetical protein